MDSLEIVPPPRGTLEMMRQTQEKSPAVRKAEVQTAEQEIIDPSIRKDFVCTTAELPVQLVEPWAINNVFGEGNRMGEPAFPQEFGPVKPHTQQDMTPDGRPIWPLPYPIPNSLKGEQMSKKIAPITSVPDEEVKDVTSVKKSFARKALNVGALCGGFALGYVVAGIFFDQKTLIKAVKALEAQTQTLENVVASYVIK